MRDVFQSCLVVVIEDERNVERQNEKTSLVVNCIIKIRETVDVSV